MLFEALQECSFLEIGMKRERCFLIRKKNNPFWKWERAVLMFHMDLRVHSYQLWVSLTFNLTSFIIHFREKCYKQNMMNTFYENVFVCKNFLSTVKKMSCIENLWFFGGCTENAKALQIVEIEQNGWFHWI